MTRDDERARQRHRRETGGLVRPQIKVADQDASEDWLLPSALLGGLALAVLFNTFIGLFPG